MGVMLAIYRLKGCCDVWLEACLGGEWLVKERERGGRWGTVSLCKVWRRGRWELLWCWEGRRVVEYKKKKNCELSFCLSCVSHEEC